MSNQLEFKINIHLHILQSLCGNEEKSWFPFHFKQKEKQTHSNVTFNYHNFNNGAMNLIPLTYCFICYSFFSPVFIHVVISFSFFSVS